MGLLDIALINIKSAIAHPPVLIILLNKEKNQQFDLMGIKEGKTIVNMDSIMLRRWRPQGSLSAWLGSLPAIGVTLTLISQELSVFI